MLLIVSGQATKARCNECRKLYAPSHAEIESQRNQRPVFICGPCRKAIDDRFRWLNAPKCRVAGSI